MENEKEFPKGIIFKKPRDGAPDFVKGSLSFKVDEFVEYLQKNIKNGWVNLDLKLSQGGKLYLDLNAGKKEEKTDTTVVPAEGMSIQF